MKIPIVCPVCCAESDGSRKFPYKAGGRSLALGQEIILCRACGGGFLSPGFSESQIKSLYEQGDFWGRYAQPDGLRELACPFVMAEARWEYLRSVVTDIEQRPLRVLDVGAGHGLFGLSGVLYNSNAISEYVAVDSDARLRQTIRTLWDKHVTGVPLRVLASTDFLEKGDRFDLIVLSHVLEHIPEPVQFLEHLTSFARGGALLFVETPFQDNKYKEDVFGHVLFLGPDHLQRILARTRWRSLSTGCFGRSKELTPMNLSSPVVFLRIIERIVGKLKRYLPLRFLMVFYDWYFGIRHRNSDGTWIRQVAIFEGVNRP